MILTVLVVSGVFGVGILIGLEIDQYFTKDNRKGHEDGSNSIVLDDYDLGWKRGYECGKINENYMRGYWKGYDDGWEGCKCGKERKNPLDRVYENFEKEVNNEL